MATLTIPYPDFQNAAPIVAAQNNSNNAFIVNFVNGLSAGINFDAGAIGTASIASQAITTALIADANVTSVKLAASLTFTTPNIGVATGTSLALSGNLTVSGDVAVTGNITYNIAILQTASGFTLSFAENGHLVEMSGGGTVLVPLNSTVAFPIGTQVTILQTGTSQVTIAGVSGVTVNGTPGLKLRAQWSSATLIKRATDTWVLMGDLSA
jgi:hypothetical protein